MKYILPIALFISTLHCSAMDDSDVNARMAKKYPTVDAIKKKLEGDCIKAEHKILKHPHKHNKKAHAQCLKCLQLIAFAQQQSDIEAKNKIEGIKSLTQARQQANEEHRNKMFEMDNLIQAKSSELNPIIEFRDYLTEYQAKHPILEKEALQEEAEYLAEDEQLSQ